MMQIVGIFRTNVDSVVGCADKTCFADIAGMTLK